MVFREVDPWLMPSQAACVSTCASDAATTQQIYREKIIADRVDDSVNNPRAGMTEYVNMWYENRSVTNVHINLQAMAFSVSCPP